MAIKPALRYALATALLILAACGGDGGSGKSTTTVGAAGGTVAGPNNLSVEIPAGALDSDVEIGVKVSSTGAPALPEGTDPATAVYEFTPHGIAFKKPVTISLPSTEDPAVKPIMMAEQGDAGWTTVKATQTGGRVSWQVMGFSWSAGPWGCAIPRNSTDPYPCSIPYSRAVLTALPAPALTLLGLTYSFDGYRLSEEATVSLTFRYTVAADCRQSAAVKIVRYRTNILDANGRTLETVLLDGVAPLTTLSPDGKHITGEVTLPGISFTYAERDQHYFRMRMQCARTYNNYHLATGGTVLIDTSTMAVPALPSITQQPTDQTVTEPATASFSAASSSIGAEVKWQRSNDGGSTWADIPGATSPTYTTLATTTADNGARFQAIFTNSSGSTPTDPATLHVNAMAATPTFVSQPANQTVAAGATATFSVTVTGIPAPTVQWQVSTDGGNTWTDIPGATSASFTTPAAANGDNGNQYRAVATNTASPGGVPSNGATLTVSGASLATSPYGKISALYEHVCAVTAAGQLRCWGSGIIGQLGNGGGSSPTPVLVSNLSNVEFVSAGVHDTCAIHGGGQLSCWGFLNGSPEPNSTGVSNAAWVSVGSGHVCYVNTGGEIWCWGENGNGQLGDGTQTSSANPVQVRWSNGTAVAGAVSVAAGGGETCARMSGGEVYCWGTGYGYARLAPERLVKLLPNGTTTDFTITGHIASGLDHACAVESSGGQTVCWGSNTYGGLGDNDVTGRDTAVAVGASGIGNVAAGRYHSCNLDSATGTSLTCWGRTYFGNGGGVVTLLYPQTAGRVSSYYNNSTAISAVAAGSDFTCALLKTSGDVQCWGSGGAGQIGNGGTSDALTPTSTSAGAIFWKP